jgi:hypothetical protein
VEARICSFPAENLSSFRACSDNFPTCCKNMLHSEEVFSLSSEWHFGKTFLFKIGLETNLELGQVSVSVWKGLVLVKPLLCYVLSLWCQRNNLFRFTPGWFSSRHVGYFWGEQNSLRHYTIFNVVYVARQWELSDQELIIITIKLQYMLMILL